MVKLMHYYLATLLDDAWKGVLAAVTGLAIFVLPTASHQEFAIAAGALICIDTLTGLIASLREGNAITSSRMGSVFVKLLGYSSVLTVTAICTKFIGGPDGSLAGATVSGVLTLIVLTESVSVLENVHRMGVPLPSNMQAWLQGRLDQERGKEKNDGPKD